LRQGIKNCTSSNTKKFETAKEKSSKEMEGEKCYKDQEKY